MITKERLINGINAYVDTEILPSVGGLMKWGLALGVGAYVGKILDGGVLEKLGYQAKDGTIDDDRLFCVLKEVAARGPVTQNVPLVGDITFTEADIDKLKRMMT